MTAGAWAPPSLDKPIELWPVERPAPAHCVGCGRRCTPMADYPVPVCHRCDDKIALVGLPADQADVWFHPGGPAAAVKRRAESPS